jgi:hypothetical protein
MTNVTVNTGISAFQKDSAATQFIFFVYSIYDIILPSQKNPGFRLFWNEAINGLVWLKKIQDKLLGIFLQPRRRVLVPPFFAAMKKATCICGIILHEGRGGFV